MVTHLDKKMYNDHLEKLEEAKKSTASLKGKPGLEIDTNPMISKTLGYVMNNDRSTPLGFDTKKLNAMKFSKRGSSKKSIAHSRARSMA